MKKTVLLAAMLALTVLAMGAPAALADEDRWNDRHHHDSRFFVVEVDQENELEAESGDIDQSFDVSGTGDNSNECVGIDGTANTGNVQNITGVSQIDSDADEFEFEDSGGSIDVSGDSTTTCDQQVNQAAAAG